MKLKTLVALFSVFIAVPVSASQKLAEPWLFLSQNKAEAIGYLEVLKNHQKGQGGDTASIEAASKIISNPLESSTEHRNQLFQVEALLRAAGRIQGTGTPKQSGDVRRFLARLYLAYLRSENPSIAKSGIRKLEDLALGNAIDGATEAAIRKELAKTSWHQKYALFLRLGLTEADKKEILGMSDATTTMKAHAGDSEALESILEKYGREKTLIEKNRIVEDLMDMDSEKAASVVFGDLYYPVKKAESPACYHPLHFRQRILILLRNTYQDDPLFKSELITRPYAPQDTGRIREYLHRVGKWGLEKFGQAPKDSLIEPFIAFPEKRFQR
jgi:hypothetical protein